MELFHIPVADMTILVLSEDMSVAGRTVSIASKTAFRAGGAVSVLVYKEAVSYSCSR